MCGINLVWCSWSEGYSHRVTGSLKWKKQQSISAWICSFKLWICDLVMRLVSDCTKKQNFFHVSLSYKLAVCLCSAVKVWFQHEGREGYRGRHFTVFWLTLILRQDIFQVRLHLNKSAGGRAAAELVLRGHGPQQLSRAAFRKQQLVKPLLILPLMPTESEFYLCSFCLTPSSTTTLKQHMCIA